MAEYTGEKMIKKSELMKIKNDIKSIIAHTDNGTKVELCGVIVRSEKGIETRQLENVAKGDKSVDYEISPQELGKKTYDTTLFRETAKNEFIAVWHTHTHNSSHPSSVDIHNCLFDRNYIIYSVMADDILVFKLSKGVE